MKSLTANDENKPITGKIHPNYSKGRLLLFCLAYLLLFALNGILFWAAVEERSIGYLIWGFLGLFAFGYLILISPYSQRPQNYDIEIIAPDGRIQGLYVTYKGRGVNVSYTLDADGRFAFSDNAYKTKCVSYSDGTRMPAFTRYRVVNYLSMALKTNNLLSEMVTPTIEA